MRAPPQAGRWGSFLPERDIRAYIKTIIVVYVKLECFVSSEVSGGWDL